MSSSAITSILPNPGPSSSSIARQRNLAQHSTAPSAPASASTHSFSHANNLKFAHIKSSSRTASALPSSNFALAPSTTIVQSTPNAKSAPLVPDLSASPTSSISSSSSSVPKKDTGGGSLVQPSKEWVLPARAKPGRKPSETEPLTKRKAQNRASQRAFRERKQSYLADLEAKVAAYEAAEIDRSVEIQKVAQKLRAENDTLRNEVSVWKEKFAHIEKLLIQVRSNGGRMPGVVPSVKSGPGCKAPAHERAVAPKKGVLVTSRTKTAKDRDKSAGGVRFADSIPEKTQAENGESNIDLPQTSASVPLRRRRANSSSASTPVDISSPASAISIDPSTAEIQPHPPQPLVEASRKGLKPPLWSFEAPKPTSPTAASTAATSATLAEKSLLSPSLLPHGGHLSVEGGCGFCTEASPCVCADDFLDLSVNQSQPSHIPLPSEPPSALPLPKRNTANASTPSENPRRMSIESLTHANDTSLDQRRRRATKLWYTVPPPESPPSISIATAVPLSIKPNGSRKRAKKLWSVAEAPSSVEPVCTGDPRTCGACSTDPGLAAFCEAVTTATTTATPPSTTPSTTNALPTRPGMLRSGTTGQISPYPLAKAETIPSAWRQIRSHPRFSQWQGGLDLLAEVVSKRSGNVDSPLLSHAKRTREASVEIEPTRSTCTSISAVATSNDRATAKPVLMHTTSDTTIHGFTSVKAEQVVRDEEEQQQREQKRRRIMIDREAVQEALALLDAGTAAQPRNTFGLGIGTRDKDEVPCPCPWRPGEKRFPYD
ncbi:uncharacterized protein MEPE_04167 [Melanopsichium pennsylvanicum]|uniref:BZIP domain-containing protein n=2 Tax=Melanopsichium pennsylvanicum TaxID=63383 RepID=A0AAJ4XNM7_9BASI|nr:b-zip transcription factor [Melanopsichium pennsylvanicum 4]SNX85458.1 uncharacterized protein MEPE_04167 [Melanopsichium pennsylvanicum]